MERVISSKQHDGYSVDRIERTYPNGRTVLMWRINVPHPDVRTQRWYSQTRVEAVKTGEWSRVGGGRDQASAKGN